MLWKAAEANGVFGRFVRLALLTGQRREKILGMRWEDLRDGEWCIPAAKREKNTAGSLVLQQEALDIINAQPRFASNAYVFAGIGSNYIGGLASSVASMGLNCHSLDAQRKARRRENRRAKRRAHNVKPREVYLAEMASKPKPWIAEGISRRTWERRLKAMSQGVVPTILTKVVPDLASPSSVESLRGATMTECWLRSIS